MLLCKVLLTRLLTLLLVHRATALDSNGSELIVELGPKRVSSFRGIGDQTILHWPVLPSTNKLILRFSGTVNESGGGISVPCPDGNVSAMVRRQAIPLPNPRGALSPDNTFISNDGVVFSGNFTVSKLAQGQPHDVEILINSSRNEHYFAGLFLPYDSGRIEVDGLTKVCHYYVSLKIYAFYAANTSASSATGCQLTNANQNDSNTTKLTRQQANIFVGNYIPLKNKFNLSIENVTQLTWDVYSGTDSGGTLEIQIVTSKIATLEPDRLVLINATLYGCLKNEFSFQSLNCSGGYLLKLNNSHIGKDMLWNIPFPIAGTWTFDIWFNCMSSDGTCSRIIQPVEVSIRIGTCIENCQSHLRHGSCGLYRTIDVLSIACGCRMGWMGLACNDGRLATSYHTQLSRTLLLTLSNLMFVPCVVLAAYRKYYTEALVYFFVAFMSLFYHACDQPGVAAYCILPYDTLQFCDFLSSISAIWFTLIALADLPIQIESWLHVFGCLSVSVAVSYKRFNLWTTVTPALVGIGVVVSRWALECRETKHCYPGRRKTSFSIVPGLACASIGLILYAFVQTSENYYIVHSIWHILIACAVLFLLPVNPKDYLSKPRELWKKSVHSCDTYVVSSNTKVNVSASLSHHHDSNCFTNPTLTHESE